MQKGKKSSIHFAKKRIAKRAATRHKTPRKTADVPPNENLKKFPDETYGDMELPFKRVRTS